MLHTFGFPTTIYKYTLNIIIQQNYNNKKFIINLKKTDFHLVVLKNARINYKKLLNMYDLCSCIMLPTFSSIQMTATAEE